MPASLHIIEYKHPDRKHIEFDAVLLQETPDYYLTLFPQGGAGAHHTRGLTWNQQMPTLQYWFKHRWFSIHIAVNDAGEIWRIYGNVNTPARVCNGRLTTVDVDLDVVWDAGGTWTVEDRDEFEQHQVEYRYSSAMIRAAEDAVTELVGMIERREHPFNLTGPDLLALLAPT